MYVFIVLAAFPSPPAPRFVLNADLYLYFLNFNRFQVQVPGYSAGVFTAATTILRLCDVSYGACRVESGDEVITKSCVKDRETTKGILASGTSSSTQYDSPACILLFTYGIASTRCDRSRASTQVAADLIGWMAGMSCFDLVQRCFDGRFPSSLPTSSSSFTKHH